MKKAKGILVIFILLVWSSIGVEWLMWCDLYKSILPAYVYIATIIGVLVITTAPAFILLIAIEELTENNKT